MALRVFMEKQKLGDTVATRATKRYNRAADAARFALSDARDRIITAGRQDISSGGKFGARWVQGLQGNIQPANKRTINLVLTITQAVPYWKVFEFGTRIFGKPLLWIPLPWNPTKVRARDFPGKLFRVERKGKNPLLMVKKGKTAQAMYVGVKSVKQKKRFHLRSIIKRVAKQIPALFRRANRIAGVK